MVTARNTFKAMRAEKRADFALSDWSIRHLLNETGLKPGSLTRLLGTPGSNIVAHWLSATYTPSAASLAKVVYLLLMDRQGINLHRIKSIDWKQTPPVIEWWPGAEPSAEEQAGFNNLTDVPTAEACKTEEK